MAIPYVDSRLFAAAQSALFIVTYHLVCLGYFLGLAKSILNPKKVVPFLGFLSHSSLEMFHLIPGKKSKFLLLVHEVLQAKMVTVCVFFLGSPRGIFFTREMNAAISRGLRTTKPLRLCGGLRKEVSHWLFLETWDDPLPWRNERHSRVSFSSY